MSTMHTTPAPPLPVRIPPKGSILSPEWSHAITTIMSHPLSSESGKFIQKWILYHAIPYPFDFWLNWDPTDPYDNKLLQEYVGSNGSVVYLPSSTIKSLINLWNYMNLLIKKEKSVDQKCNAQYFQDDQWFNLTAQDMRITLVNAGIRYHRPQIIPGTPLPNSTSPPSLAPMKSSIHLEPTPCDPTSTIQTTCNFDTESLPELKGHLHITNQEPTDTPSTMPTAFQVSCGHTLHPECTHNLMAIQCNQYPNPNHNSALVQFLAHPNCEDLDPTDTPSAVPTAFQATSDDTYNPKCAHNPMETQCNQSQFSTLMKHNCTHNPSTSQVKESNHINPMAFPYPPDPGEHIVERSATPTTLVERDKLDLSSLVPPKGEIESSFSWTCPFKCPTSSTLCFGEPTLGELNQETELYMTKHMPKSFSETNRVSDCHSSLVTTPSSRLILDEPKIEVAKALIHHIGKNGELFYGENFICDFPQSWKHIKEVDWGDKLKLNYTISGYMLKEVDWGDKSNCTSCGCPMANWHESFLSEVDWGAHHSSVFLFLVDIDYDAKSQDFFTQGIWGGLAVRTSSTTLRSLNHVKGKLANYLNLQKDPSRLDHQLDQQKDSKSSPCPQYESIYNLLNQWDPGENLLLPQHFRTIISAKVIYFLWMQSKYKLSCIL